MEKVVISSEQHFNKDGTYYQSRAGPKVKRKHFFAPLDAAHAEAVTKDAENVVFTPEEEVCRLNLGYFCVF